MPSNNLRFDAITFDMGFTLVDLQGRFDRDLIDLAAAAGLSITEADVRQAFHQVWEREFQQDAVRRWEPSVAADDEQSFEIDRRTCLHLGLTDPEQHREAHRRSRAIFHDPATYRVFPEVRKTLDHVRELPLTIGIVSNWGWWLPELCQTLELAPYFDFIISSARVGAAKPHPAIFQEALQRSGSVPQRMMHVGDSLAADVRGAQSLGITGVLIDRPGLESYDGHPVIRSLDEVIALLS